LYCAAIGVYLGYLKLLKKLHKSINIFLFLIFFSFGNSVIYAQKGGIPLADEYFKNQEYEKASSIYVNFINTYDEAQKVYNNYAFCLKTLKKKDELEKLILKMIKWNNISPIYKVDLYIFYLENGKKSDIKKAFENILLSTRQNINIVQPTGEYLVKNNLLEEAKAVYTLARKSYGSEMYYNLEMAQIHKLQKEPELMINELVRTLIANQSDKEFLKSKFQDFITTEQEFEMFEKNVLMRIQDDPNQTLYNELLIWIYTQQKKFDKAFIQAKALDRILKTQGAKLFEIGKIALENKEYNAAIEIFEYITQIYNQGKFYAQASKLKIQAKEEIVKSTYPINTQEIRNLINDYHTIERTIGNPRENLEIKRSIALLYAFYLDQKDSALAYLKEVSTSPYADVQLISKCKLDMGDIYLLKDEPWESTLLYSQVEKLQKDQILGHEAKLRNAKLSYYTGQFELAKEHLDVLKLATHREIANDAIDLSLFIQDHTTMEQDTNFTLLKKYSSIELLLFQNKIEKAIKELEELRKQVENLPLEEEVLFLQAKTYLKIQNFEKTLELLTLLENKNALGIYADDAAFMIATITEEKLKQIDKAMELYNQFLVKYSGSIYTSEARKRLRILRGDILN
jgi:tetratricopeptide (TPR) repeat protein